MQMRAVSLEDLGEGPLVVYVPGIDGTGELLFDTADTLATRFRVRRMRYVGDGPRSGALYGVLADSIAAAMEGTPALVVAESFGGGVALTLALRRPDLVRGLLLVNTFARFPHRLRIALGARIMPAVPRWALSLGRRTMPGRLFFRPRRDERAEACFRAMKPGFFDPGYSARMAAIRDLDLRAELPSIEGPCALYAASHDRVLPSPRTMAAMAEALPDATLEVLPRAGHIVLPLGEEPWLERAVALHDRCGGAVEP